MALPKDVKGFNMASLGIKDKMTRETVKEAGIYCLIGAPGSGKSTITANLPRVAIIQVGNETGANNLPQYKAPTYDQLGLSQSDHLFAMLQFYRYEEHKFENIVIDNTGTAQLAFFADVEADYKGNEDLGDKGKGAGMCRPYWVRLLNYCHDIAKNRGINVWLLGHPLEYNVNNKDGSYYTKVSINLPRSPSVAIAQMVLERSAGVFFIISNYMQLVDKRGLGAALASNTAHKKKDAIGERQLTILTAERDGIEAKNRSFTMKDEYEIEISENKRDAVTGKNESIMTFLYDVTGKPVKQQPKVETNE